MATSVFGLTISCSSPTTADVWDQALLGFLEMRTDPFVTLAGPIEADQSFVMGPLLRATYTLLGGAPKDSPAVVRDRKIVDQRANSATLAEQRHAEALGVLASHNFIAAASLWDAIAAENPRDLLATRIAHDIYLHVGDAEERLRSLAQVAGTYEADGADSGIAGGLIDGMRSFAFEELGDYAAAESLGQRALASNPLDIWAVHALAHTYEMQQRTDDLLTLLDPAAGWPNHELLANHLWWHRGIRLVAEGRLVEALAIADLIDFDSTAPFSLADVTSLLWRIELAGGNVGDRWEQVVLTWQTVATRHSNGFLDVHAMLAFTAAAPAIGEAWRATLRQRVADSPASAPSENDEIFATVVEPLVGAIATLRSPQRGEGVATIRQLEGQIHRIGGSVAQRDIIQLSINDRAPGVPT